MKPLPVKVIRSLPLNPQASERANIVAQIFSETLDDVLPEHAEKELENAEVLLFFRTWRAELLCNSGSVSTLAHEGCAAPNAS
jgi:hypothetical protein